MFLSSVIAIIVTIRFIADRICIITHDRAAVNRSIGRRIAINHGHMVTMM